MGKPVFWRLRCKLSLLYFKSLFDTIESKVFPKAMSTETVAWVQCDHAKCMKWRKIPRSLVSTIENVPWYCHMNPDKNHASCSSEQEVIRASKGEKFIFSLLEEGSLVWIKLCGYPRYGSS